MSQSTKNCCIIVLGDFGRSPRMQYHTQSLLDEEFNVDIISYLESEPLEIIKKNPKVKFHKMKVFPELSSLPNLVKYILKTFWQIFTLLISLFTINRPKFIIVQNPPAIPTFIICSIYCKIMRVKFFIDWHNYTHSILAINSRRESFIVRLSHWIERFFGRLAQANFCVTKAMQNDLRNNWGIEATVLYDRPAVQFQPITLEKKHDLYKKLSKDYEQFACNKITVAAEEGDFIERTAFTRKLQDNSVILEKERPAILISSTSWTPDEDFSILLTALEEYDKIAENTTIYPKLLCIITGKGPEKEYYINEIKKKNWKNVSIITPWLEIEDYPLMLASSDLGVCLHWSSSGLDLPMKVVDMFGVGLIVCAKNFNCLNELLRHKENGFVFDDSTELTNQILNWLQDFPNNLNIQLQKETIQKNLKIFQSLRWKENWLLVVRPIIYEA